MVKIWGCIGNRQVLFDNRVQQRLGQYLVTKDPRNLSDEVNSLDGLVIDWHLAEYDYSIELPVVNDEPTYAYAA